MQEIYSFNNSTTIKYHMWFFVGCGIGLLVSSYIYIAIQQRLLFLVFSILNIIAAIFYSIYFLLTHKKSSIKNVIVSTNNNNVTEEGNFIYKRKK